MSRIVYLTALLPLALVYLLPCGSNTTRLDAAASGHLPGYNLSPTTSDDAAGWRWVNTPWIASDPAYSKATIDIGRLSPSGLISYRDKARQDVLQNPDDRLSIYKWALSTFESAPGAGLGTDDPLRYPVMMALQSLAPPYNYELARMRFLFILSFCNEANLIPLGERLLNRNPRDFPVKFGFVGCLMSSYLRRPDTAVEQRMLRLAEELVAEGHDPAICHGLLAGVYETLWEKNGYARPFANSAIAEYREYLLLAPRDDPFHSGALTMIGIIQKRTPK
jgi:hypothetical protein